MDAMIRNFVRLEVALFGFSELVFHKRLIYSVSVFETAKYSMQIELSHMLNTGREVKIK